jgi:hypothetical protein
MNISLIMSDFHSSKQILCPLTPEEYETFLTAGLIIKKMRSYRMEFKYINYQVDCPVKVKDNQPIGIIFPAFKLPYRRYPCYVYLFAISLILTGISMRKAAKMTGKKFGIPQFSHSTISRTFALILPKAEQLSACFQEEAPCMQQEIIPMHPPELPTFSVPFLSRQYKDEKVKAAATLSVILHPLLQKPEHGIHLVYAYFIKYRCLLF